MELAVEMVISVFLAATASASERGTPAEAKAMLAKAAAHHKAVGAQQAHADFTGRKAPFFDRDLYVACIDPDHVTLANGGYPAYVGTSVDLVRDADGKPLGKAFLDAVARTGEGSVEYRWLNPVSHKVEAKVGFVQKVGAGVCVVGAYNPSK